MAPTLKLVYFDGRGRAELIRLALHQAGVKFEDKRIQFSEWPAVKPTTPFGSLPYMEIDGQPFAESLSLARYAARTFNLMGKNELEALEADSILSLMDELRSKFIRIKFDSVVNDEQKAKLQKTLTEEQLPAFLAKIEKKLTDSKTGFFIGNAISIAELAIYDITEGLVRESATALDKYPKVAGVRKTVEASPNIKAYLSTRKDTPM